jgi:hypothetical protein
VYEVVEGICQPALPDLIRKFIYNAVTNNIRQSSNDVDLDLCPDISNLRIYTYPSARAVFFAPSDLSGIEGMKCERIRAVSSWYKKPRHDCVLIGTSDEPGFAGYDVARIFLFFSFKYLETAYQCALVHWFSKTGDAPCADTGMWIVQPDFHRAQNGVREPVLDVVDIDCILRSVHLIGVSGKEYIPTHGFDFSMSLDSFNSFYVNKYADHHANEILF